MSTVEEVTKVVTLTLTGAPHVIDNFLSTVQAGLQRVGVAVAVKDNGAVDMTYVDAATDEVTMMIQAPWSTANGQSTGNKIRAIRALRQHTDMGLKEAKDFIERGAGRADIHSAIFEAARKRALIKALNLDPNDI